MVSIAEKFMCGVARNIRALLFNGIGLRKAQKINNLANLQYHY